jgi:hypothetical protein
LLEEGYILYTSIIAFSSRSNEPEIRERDDGIYIGKPTGMARRNNDIFIDGAPERVLERVYECIIGRYIRACLLYYIMY